MHTVTRDDAGLRLTAFLGKRLGSGVSQKALKRLLESNRCLVNGRVERYSSTRVKVGDCIQLKEAMSTTREPVILFEDEHFSIIDKPPGVISEQLSSLLVHRLDKETSGVMLLPKTDAAYRALRKLFEQHAIDKQYIAWVDRTPSQQEGTISAPIARQESSGLPLFAVAEHGKEAVTRWRLLESRDNMAKVRCSPVTGRTHQIRLHMRHIGHPVLGDYTYCRDFQSGVRPARTLLHAESIAFIHPLKGTNIHVTAPIPDDCRL